jgi:hypothetical protein
MTALQEVQIAEQATGCRGAGGYLNFALQRGYSHVEVLDWTSSAGDWQFLVSRDGNEWQILHQTNNYPRPGFSYFISDDVFYGTLEEVYKQIEQILSSVV